MAGIQFGSITADRYQTFKQRLLDQPTGIPPRFEHFLHQPAPLPPRFIDDVRPPWNGISYERATIASLRFGLYEWGLKQPREYRIVKEAGELINTDIPISLTRLYRQLYALQLGERRNNRVRLQAVMQSSKIHIHRPHQNILRGILNPENPEYCCFHDDFKKSLHNLLVEKKKEFFWTLFEPENENFKPYYSMSIKFRTIIRGIVCGITFLREMQHPVTNIDPKYVVFDGSDKDFSTPLLIDCCVIKRGGGVPAKNLRAVASLIIEIACRHEVMRNSNVEPEEEHFLNPLTLLFLRYLRVDREDYSGEVFHPIFLNFDEKTEYLIRVNDRMHEPSFEQFGFSIEDIHSWMTGFVAYGDDGVDQYSRWDIILRWSKELNVTLYRRKDGKAWNFYSIRDFITYLRNIYVHSNDDKKKDEKNAKEKGKRNTNDYVVLTDRKNYGKYTEEACAALIPLLFLHQGNLMKRVKL